LIIDKKFLYGGRILANRGLDKKGIKVTLSKCYVITPPEDNIESIYGTAAKLARTFSYGGGCGIDISKLAPRGARVNNTAKWTSGAVSFMETYSQVTSQIG
jgi:ribonucleoside-diphosphate reductase alpha chain